jgi:hypothetical protein
MVVVVVVGDKVGIGTGTACVFFVLCGERKWSWRYSKEPPEQKWQWDGGFESVLLVVDLVLFPRWEDMGTLIGFIFLGTIITVTITTTTNNKTILAHVVVVMNHMNAIWVWRIRSDTPETITIIIIIIIITTDSLRRWLFFVRNNRWCKHQKQFDPSFLGG